jgi:DNA-binding NarL/FixJ family response regulator
MPNSEGTGAVKQPSAGRLTERELQVMRLMFDGCPTRKIASKLGISPKTAGCHRNNILAKLEVRNTVMAFRRAIQLGLIKP